jgi:MraZ protein
MLLTGSYRRTLDEKLRLAIPKQLREAIGCTEEVENSLFITPGTDRSLAIYTAPVLQALGESLARNSPAAKDTRLFSRLFYAQAQPAEVDRQGRLRIPPELAQLASITSEVVVLGVRDHIELWDAGAWMEFLAATQPRYDELAESVLRGETSPEL